MGKTIAKFTLYVFAALVGFWTVKNSWGTMKIVFPDDPMIQVLGIVIFDVAMVVWLYLFLKDAQGIVPRAIAVSASLISLVGTVLMSVGHLYLGGQTLAAIPPDLGNYVLWAIAGMTGLHVACLWAYHVTEPNTWMELRQSMGQERIMARAYKQADMQIDDIAEDTARIIGGGWADSARLRALEAAGVGMLPAVTVTEPLDRPNGAPVGIHLPMPAPAPEMRTMEAAAPAYTPPVSDIPNIPNGGTTPNPKPRRTAK